MANRLATTTYLQTHLNVHSYLSLSFGLDAARERAIRFIHAAYTSYEGFMPYGIYLASAFSITSQPSRGVPSGSILLWASGALNLHLSDKFWQLSSYASGQTFNIQYCILDMIANPLLVIPSHIFRPYNGTARRGEAALESTDMLPIFFTQADGVHVGLSVAENANLSVIPDTPTRVSRSTIKVVLHLLNYNFYETQVRLRNSSSGDGTISARQLARQVAKVVRCCITKAAERETTLSHWENPRWRFGSGPGCTRIEDVELVGVIFVSPGKITPMLQLRSNFAS